MHRAEGTYPQSVIALSEEELYVILNLLKAPMIAGINLSSFQDGSNGHPSEHTTGALSAATRSLIARGYLMPLQGQSEQPLIFGSSQEVRKQSWNRATLPDEVQVPVVVSAFAAKSLLLTWHTASGRDLLYVHERDGLFVIIAGMLAGVFTFNSLTDWEAVWQTIANKFPLEERQSPQPPLPTIKLRHETLMNLQQYTSQPEEEQRAFYTRLTQAGIPSSAAQALLEAFKEVLVVATFQMLDKKEANDKQP
ncbi:MAG TPA: hypothetical protein VH593_03160, partial [Ktedonobacteraceae bacterium]